MASGIAGHVAASGLRALAQGKALLDLGVARALPFDDGSFDAVVYIGMLRLLPRGTHDPAMFIKPRELRAAMQAAGLVPGATIGLGPRGINRRFDLTFGPLPLTAILYMGTARKPISGALT